jgi:tripartite-type tricarboxylate transporter receptor subunit TctC
MGGAMFKQWKCLFILATAVLTHGLPGYAQSSYPNKPIKLFVGFPPGGGVDFTARLIAPHLAEALGQQVIIENKPGAAGVIALSELTRAAPDGYSLALANIGPMVLAPNMMAKKPYDPLKDLTPIGQIVSTYFLAVVPKDLPVDSLKSFIQWAKKNPDKANFASGGNGSITHLNGELLNTLGGTKLTHVPYKGSAPAIVDLVSGQTHILIDITGILVPQVQSGTLKAIAITSPTRDKDLPNVPTVRESGFAELETSGWQGLVGPAGMPKEVVQKIQAALKKALANPDVRERLEKAGTPITERSSAEFANFIKSENDRWASVIKASGASMD